MAADEIQVGTKIPCRSNRTIDEGEMSILHSLLWFIEPTHVDAEHAKQSFTKQRNLAGPIIFAVADGMVQVGGGIDNLLRGHGFQVMAYLGMDDVRITHPVVAGDTLRPDVEVSEIRPTKNPQRSILLFTNKTYNQRNELVVQYTGKIMFQRNG